MTDRRITPTPRESRRGGRFLGSRLSQTIVLFNLLGLAVLVAGALILNESGQGLVKARLESLSLEGEVIANVLDQTATLSEPAPYLDALAADRVLRTLFIPRAQRARLYDPGGRLLADTSGVSRTLGRHPRPRAPQAREARVALTREVSGALSGGTLSDLRVDEDGRRVVSVSIPVRHARAVLGVLTLESADVDTIILVQRTSLIPFVLIAVGVALLSSLALIQRIAVPVLRLARAADKVRLSRARAISLPDLAGRDDELGDLTRSLESMTLALSQRMVAIERFAADVSHELRNPMTSIRSAVETLELVKTEAQRNRLTSILQHDVGRLDRLISDISNASRLDAELARNPPGPMDLNRLLGDICEFYTATGKPTDAAVIYSGPPGSYAIMVVGREGPLGQVFRNLIDNARSFSPPGGVVKVSVVRGRGEVQVSVDDEGPGVPPDNLETVFERFYTSRPKGAAFGGNSGLGLAIARQIVETHGGRLWAENRLAEDRVVGASFRVVLPAL